MKKLFLPLLALVLLNSCEQNSKHIQKTKTDSNGLKYNYFTNDPYNLRIYTLENGLKVYLSQNKTQARIQTAIAVKAGSTYDPRETTGLAHYFEHLMFKGTDKYGTSNWDKEKKELDIITELFEEHKDCIDPEEKKIIYNNIDSVSQIAASYAIPSEYDKMISSLGATGTNAYTSLEKTVYINNIPSNELEKWMTIECERFRNPILRLFHTELETVYEEFNMSQDRDGSKAYHALMASLFEKHPYGIPVIGFGEHLKNPSIKNIYNFFNTYYVPNNMAICLSGDFDYDQTIKLISDKFDFMVPKELPEHNFPQEEPINSIRTNEVYGPESEVVSFMFRFNGINSSDYKYVQLLNKILGDGHVGKIHLNLVKDQIINSGGCWQNFNRDYGYHNFYGAPKKDQDLKEVEKALNNEINKIKNGDFEDWLIQAAIDNIKLEAIKNNANNDHRNYNLIASFIEEVKWKDKLSLIDELEKITKEDLMNFVKNNYKDNYAVVYKRQGVDTSTIKVEKPKITEIPLNRDMQSDFFNNIEKMESPDIEPVFPKIGKDITVDKIKSGLEFNYIKSPTPEVFSLYIISNLCENHIRKLPIAFDYLKLAGNKKYSGNEMQLESYKNGITLWSRHGKNHCLVSVEGLDKSFEKGLEILNEYITDVNVDQEALDKVIEKSLKDREDWKTNKWHILFNGMINYAKYGETSPELTELSEEELKAIDPQELVDILQDVFNYKHRIIYSGGRDEKEVKSIISENYSSKENLKDLPKPRKLVEQDNSKNKVYVVDFDMVQCMISLVAKDQIFDPDLLNESEMFREYFGQGLSSIIFQKVRESQGLAYSAWGNYDNAPTPDNYFYTSAFISTQSDKLMLGINTINDLMNNMPRSDIQFEASKQSILKRLSSERILNLRLVFTYIWLDQMGIKEFNQEKTYNIISKMNMDDLQKFFDIHVKGKNFTYLILGDKDKLDLQALATIGDVEVLKLDDIFSY